MSVTIQNVTVKRETEKALLVEIDGEEHWVPQSQIDDASEVYAMGTEGKLVVTTWFARKKEWI